MTYLVGIGNAFRGEDGFGHDVVKAFVGREDCCVMQVSQLLPEHCETFKDAQKIIFVDASYGIPSYALACALPTQENGLTHQLTPQLLLTMLRHLYKAAPHYQIYSMLSINFDRIEDTNSYDAAVEKTIKHINIS